MQYLLLPQCFLLKQMIVSPFVHIFAIISIFAAELEEPKIGISGKGFTWRISFEESLLFTFCLTLNNCMMQLHAGDIDHCSVCWHFFAAIFSHSFHLNDLKLTKQIAVMSSFACCVFHTLSQTSLSFYVSEVQVF